jgi:hypothetical protein
MPMMTTITMSTVLRPAVPSRFRRGRAHPSVEALLEEISGLTVQRQLLRERGVDAVKLERNRVKLARAQWELSHALIERYLPAADSAAA